MLHTHFSLRYPLFLALFLLASATFGQSSVFRKVDTDLLPNGQKFQFWEDQTRYQKTYFVNGQTGSDANPGTEAAPFRTISKAAAVLQPGEKVIVREGVYRETIRPARGGESPARMIAYQAAPGENVVVKGSFEMQPERWQRSVSDWNFLKKGQDTLQNQQLNVWKYTFEGSEFNGYNPFGMLNLMGDTEWLQIKLANMTPHLKRRGQLFKNGQPLWQVAKLKELADTVNAYWVEHNGLTVHVRLPEGETPAQSGWEATQREQLFVPAQPEMGYIRLSGFAFEQCGNGFPVPQAGMVSTNKGHHFIIEDCRMAHANSVGLQLSEPMWHTFTATQPDFHIVRRNHLHHIGICGMAGMHLENSLIEDNLLEHCGWQNAEHAFESGGIKLHWTRDVLIRRNVFRNITYAPGLWLDYGCKNTRVTQNVFAHIKTARGAIYVEVSQYRNQLDHNFIYDLTSQYWLSGDYGAGGSGIYQDGSDSLQIQNNLIANIENAGYESSTNTDRMVEGRGGTARVHLVQDNLFIDCRKQAIQLPHAFNTVDGNLYSQMPEGFLLIKTPEKFKLHLKAWQDYYGFDRRGQMVKTKLTFRSEDLRLSLSVEGGHPNAGPFTSLQLTDALIDPRKLSR